MHRYGYVHVHQFNIQVHVHVTLIIITNLGVKYIETKDQFLYNKLVFRYKNAKML